MAKVVHIIRYKDRGERQETGCRKPVPSDPNSYTGDSRKVTCKKCLDYIRATGNGPEILKSLLTF